MARLQVLYLPSAQDPDGVIIPRFALVLDEVPADLAEAEAGGVRDFAQTVGAAGVLVTRQTVDLVQGEGEELSEELAEEIARLVREQVRAEVDAAERRRDAPARLAALGLLPSSTRGPAPTSRPETGPKPIVTWGTPVRDPREGIPGWEPEPAAVSVDG